jgi:membrane-bound ClpP family serine protease
MEKYCTVFLLEPDNLIDSTDLDRVFIALSELNPDRNKDVMLILLSRGGSIEPAYQISKLCKSYAAGRFVAVVPRHAKSAATLIAIGADEIHMGPLGQLGPIDPQLGGLPALGVSQALRTMASVAQEFPGSSEMFARYLRMVLTVEQIGYCDRISESAVQYAERLLSSKSNLPKAPEAVAKDLVHEYKDHGFVIDIEEARMHLGSDWIKNGTAEVAAAEQIYTHFELVNFFLGFGRSKRLIVVGSVSQPDSIMILKKD